MSSQLTSARGESNKSSEAKFEDIWTSLVQNLDDIFMSNKINKLTYILMHTNVHDICASNPLASESETVSLTDTVTELDLSNGKWLYDRLVTYLHSICRQILDRLTPLGEAELLNKCVEEWTRFREAMRLCNDIFSYLNSSWILGISPREGPELVVQSLGYYVWKKTVFGGLCHQIGNILMQLISANRIRPVNDSEMIKSLVDIYVTVNFPESGPADRPSELDLYVEHIEDPFVEQVTEYYSSRKDEHFNSPFNSVESYIRKVDTFFTFEREFMQEYLHKSSLGRVEGVLRNILVVSMSSDIINQINGFISERKYSEIKLVYDLFASCPDQMNELKLIFEELVFKYGVTAVKELYNDGGDVENPTAFVDRVIDVHDRFKQVVQKSFADYKLFYTYVEKGCIRFVNSMRFLPPQHCPALILSLHCDRVIRQSTRTINRPSVEREFCRMILLLRFIKEKDVFQNSYAMGLARRLITTSRSKSALEIEKEFISLLRNECGQDYTCKLTRMISEASNFETLNEEFRHELSSKGKILTYNLNMAVFSPWPFQESYKINLPPEMTRICDLFENFYGTLNEGRKISWLNNQSYGEVVLNCFRRAYNVTATTYQIVVLMLFNDHVRLSVADIHHITLIDYDDLIYTCGSLLGWGLLLAEDSASTPKDSKAELTAVDWLSLNVNFSSTMYRLNIVIPERVKQTVDNTKVVVNVVQDRSMLIKTIVVHIMKQCGEATHNELVTELLNRLSARFVPEMSLVKEGIESMLEKEYICRSPDNPLIYRYVV